MSNRQSRYQQLRKKRKRRFKKKLYAILLYLSELEFHISIKQILCCLCVCLLIGSLFLPVRYKNETPSPQMLFANQLCNSIRLTLQQNELPAADIILLLLPKSEQQTKETFLSSIEETGLETAPLYGVYLSGKEVYWMTELYTSLAKSFGETIPYLSGLKLTYHPYRLILNRTLTAALLHADGSTTELQHDALYHVVGTDTLFYLFDFLESRSEHLLSIQPKDQTGTILSEAASPLFQTDGSVLTLAQAGQFMQKTREETVFSSATARTTSLNISVLLGSPNQSTIFIFLISGVFILLLFFAFPRIKRICIWIRIYMIRRRKRSRKAFYKKRTK